jgi:hypothetical protein
MERLEVGLLDPTRGKVQFELYHLLRNMSSIPVETTLTFGCDLEKIRPHLLRLFGGAMTLICVDTVHRYTPSRGMYEVDLTETPTIRDAQGQFVYLQVLVADRSRQRMVRRRQIGLVPPAVPEWGASKDAPEPGQVVCEAGHGCCHGSAAAAAAAAAMTSSSTTSPMAIVAEELGAEHTPRRELLPRANSPRSARRVTTHALAISAAWVDPADPTRRGSFPCQARVLRQAKLRPEPSVASKWTGSGAPVSVEPMEIVEVLGDSEYPNTGFYSIRKQSGAQGCGRAVSVICVASSH